MSDTRDDALHNIRQQQADLRARLDALDLEILKLKLPETPEPLDPPQPDPSSPPGTAFTSAKLRNKSDVPPPLPDKGEPAAEKPAAPAAVAAPAPPATTAADLEMKVGMVWLVRIGVGLLLTALVFGSKLAYTHFIADLPAAGKAAIWYLFGTALTVAGTVLERRELLANYARVLTAGGLAAIYYITYAIHHVDRLRVVENPVLAGALLLACALGILGFALYKNARSIAIAAVVLAYYAGSISPIGNFTMFSNLLLTGVGTAFLVRHRWLSVGVVSLVATYLSFFFWQFIYAEVSNDASRLAFAPTLGYLTGYWLLFAAGAVLTKAESFSHNARLAFASANTATFFFIGTVLVLAEANDATAADPALIEFWQFSLALGIAQLAIAALPRFAPALRDRFTPTFTDTLIGAGLTFITLAAFAKLDGYQLSLTLAVEGAVLLALRLRRPGALTERPILLIASITATLLGAAVIALHYLDNGTPIPAPTAAASFVLGIGCSAVLSRRLASVALVPVPVGLFVVAALVAGATGLLPHLPIDARPLTLVAAAAGLTAVSSFRPARLRALAPLAGFYTLGGAVWFAGRQMEIGVPFPFWNSVPAIAAALFLLAWWQHRAPRELRPTDRSAARGLHAAALCAMLAATVHVNIGVLANWQLAGGVTAVALTLVALTLRSWALLLAAQVFHVIAVTFFFSQGVEATSTAALSLAPTGLLTATAALLLNTVSAFSLTGDTGRIVRFTATVSIAAAAATYVVWSVRFFPETATILVTLAGLLTFAAGLVTRVRAARLVALAVLAIALVRILAVDVWGFATFLRFLTFFLVGAVLVALGFVYNRYQETLRKFL